MVLFGGCIRSLDVARRKLAGGALGIRRLMLRWNRFSTYSKEIMLKNATLLHLAK